MTENSLAPTADHCSRLVVVEEALDLNLGLVGPIVEEPKNLLLSYVDKVKWR